MQSSDTTTLIGTKRTTSVLQLGPINQAKRQKEGQSQTGNCGSGLHGCLLAGERIGT